MRKIIILLVLFQIYTTAVAQEKLGFNFGVNSWQAFGDRASIYAPTFNVGTDLLFSLKKVTISVGYNFSYLRFRAKENPYSIYFSDVNLNLFYSIDDRRKHYFHHGLGTYIHHNLKNTEVYYLIDDPFYQALRIHYPPGVELDPQQYALLKKMPFFIESGYRFYVVDNFYLGLSGRVSLIRYETPIPDDNSDIIVSKLGFSYSIFYGLGYTFGRDK
jgi:hypothetical protein